jgi:TrmH family RNA methyltransferase
LWEKLRLAKFRQQEGFFLAEGLKVVQELLKSNWEIQAILVMEEKQQWRELLSLIPQNVAIYHLTESQWKKLSQDKTPEGIMAVVSTPQNMHIADLLDQQTGGHLLLLFEINNPSNLGALIRTAHWFGFREILLSVGSVDFTNPKVVRTSMGSLFHLNFIQDVVFEEALPRIKDRFFLIGSHVKAGLHPHPCTRRTALLLDSESQGLPESLLSMTDERWFIHGLGGADSLSLTHAAAIMMYACTRSF